SIGWALRHPEISSVILGIRSQEQLESSIRGAAVEIPQEHLDQIDELFPLAMDLRWNFGAPKIRAWQ
ncbi:MAG: aldo/keto reductase, partial [Acidobacteria bacterium]|nr:aldo/keto reductase [Acidobacteriota bacterium]